MIAALPMYDWPEFRAETDALWAALRDALRAAGFQAPAALSRGGDPWAGWTDPALCLSQTCGLPYAARLADRVTLLGAPAYDLADTPPGMYRSEIVVRADDPAAGPGDLAGRRFAYNMRTSQSGWAALAAELPIDRHFGALVETGAHRRSIRAVAAGRADCAAIDAVAWRLARRVEPAAARLRVLWRTPPTPGLPLITRRRPAAEAARMAAAVAAGLDALAPGPRAALGVAGFRRWRPGDYAPLAAGWPGDADQR